MRLDKHQPTNSTVCLVCLSIGVCMSLLLVAAHAAHAAPPVGFEAAWRRAAVTFAQHIQPDMSEAKKKELQEGLAYTDPKPPLARWAGPLTHPSVGRASSVYYAKTNSLLCRASTDEL